jgi:hypothetical protein
MLANDGRLAEALQRLEQAGAAARASGQTAVAADIDATIRVVRERLGRSK